ncbi:hypothetical protein BDE02_05G004000 [Populus trichocarpa]|nr:hypothetical protein BDE02_05G004000 [Populus trichocarpa]
MAGQIWEPEPLHSFFPSSLQVPCRFTPFPPETSIFLIFQFSFGIFYSPISPTDSRVNEEKTHAWTGKVRDA